MNRINFLKLLFQPGKAFEYIAGDNSAAVLQVIQYAFFILILPPLFSWVGGSNFGWRLGGSEPVFMDGTGAVFFSFFYFCVLCIGFVGTALASRWMAPTYGANSNFLQHFAFFTIVCTPLSIASIAHLFPDVFFNVLVLLPAAIWSTTLLYKGLPVVFCIPPERGLLMSSSLVAWLIVAATSLLGISVALWVKGAGSLLGLKDVF